MNAVTILLGIETDLSLRKDKINAKIHGKLSLRKIYLSSELPHSKTADYFTSSSVKHDKKQSQWISYNFTHKEFSLNSFPSKSILTRDCNWILTHNHLVRKQIPNHLSKLSGCGIDSRCSHLSFRYHACFVQDVPWHSGCYRVLTHKIYT